MNCGKILYGEAGSEVEVNSTYSWKADEANGIQITVNLDLQQYIDTDDTFPGAWEFGYIRLPLASINEFLGITVTDDLTIDNFVPVATTVEGEASGWTSYKPGMWLNGDGKACGWGDGYAYWQWYIWGGKDVDGTGAVYYDYGDGEDDARDYSAYKGILLIGSNPGNAKKAAGKTIKSHNLIKLDSGDVNFDITFIFSDYDDGGDDGYDHNDPVTDLSGTANLMIDRDTESNIPLTWTISKDDIDFTATVSISGLAEIDEDWAMEYDEEDKAYYGGPYRIGYVKFDLGIFTDIIGKDITTTTIDDFYPCDEDGNKITKFYTASETGLVENDVDADGWTAWNNCPGEWVLSDSRAGNWSSGAAYWWLNLNDDSHINEVNCYGAFVIGNGPNAAHNPGDQVVSYNSLCGIPFTVTVLYTE